ncbi:chromate efflux transporter [Sphingomonas sp. Y38-1Y]|uniref:chromate efflux transporter n=1 Tax=Sphingomonas sp. Y38-1Y TaxID=3078265 RepID=UPI0028E3391D|nr:chromate efflux transporter [Sphingomonas sp. Y38-1Y]
MADARPPVLTLPQLFWRFLRFGFNAFGGPVAQIAMIREALVERERWIEPARFNRLLGVMQVLPGPEAHELCVHMGMLARGRIGGLLAGLGFMLPGLVLMMVAAAAYTALVEGRAGFEGVLLGVQAAVLAVIVRAVWRIGRHVLAERVAVGLALIAFAATLAGVPFWLLLIAAGLASALATRVAAVLMPVALAAIAGLWLPGVGPGPAPSAASAASLAALFVAGLKGGLLTFGGAYTAIPYVRADTVGRGWLSDGAFLDGVAVAGLLPAPLVIFATFAGYVAGGPAGALAITAGMFLPAFAFSMIFFERLEAVVADPRLHRTLDGVAAAVVGIIAATVVDLAIGTATRTPAPVATAAIFAVAAVAAWRLKGSWVTPALVAGGAAIGSLAIR